MIDSHRSKWLWLVICAFVVTPLACNFPGASSTPDPLPTYAAQTVEARLTLAAVSTVPPTSEATDTPESAESPLSTTPTSTNTPLPATETAVPCDTASFVADVTIPDGEVIPPDDAFTKTWRLKNTGTCTWNSNYSLVFDHGDVMGGPASVDFPSGDVTPGETMDISVDLTAPDTPGGYQGFWKLRNPDGIVFGVGRTGDVAFWVEIEVSPVLETTSMAAITSESGLVRSDGSVSGDLEAGDTDNDRSVQAFFSFDIADISEDATITDVVVDFHDHTISGDPFGDLDCLDLFKDEFGSLDSGDYFTGTTSGRLIRWCSPSHLSSEVSDDDMVNAVQSQVGSNRFQIRLQFQTDISADLSEDLVRFGSPELTITYY